MTLYRSTDRKMAGTNFHVLETSVPPGKKTEVWFGKPISRVASSSELEP